MGKTLAIVKWCLIIWGGLSLIGMLTIGGLYLIQFRPANRLRADPLSVHDVRFILNGCNLGEKRFERVVERHVSARSFAGDHLDAYAIKVTHVSIEELTASTAASQERWYRGDRLPKILDDAVSFAAVGVRAAGISWFPSEAALRSDEVYIYSWSVSYHGTEPCAAEIVYVRPTDRMVFFFSGKT